MNIIIQALLFLCALLVNFVVPFVYGIVAYGVFIKANILVFVFHKLMDLITEPLIGRVRAGNIFPMSLIISIMGLLFFVSLNLVTSVGSAYLLGAMLLSSCVMLSMHALTLRKLLILYLCIFLISFFSLLLIVQFNIFQLTISEIIFYTNLIPSLIVLPILIRLSPKLPGFMEFKDLFFSIISMAPGNFSVSFVFNIFTNLLPYIFSKTFPVSDLAIFKIVTSIVQSAVAIFPINTKSIFVCLVNSAYKESFFRIIISWALLYFSLVGFILIFFVNFKAGLIQYITLSACLPALYFAVTAERFLQTVNCRKWLIWVNLAAGIVLLIFSYKVRDINSAIIFYAVGLALYAFLLLILLRNISGIFKIAPVLLISPFIVWLQDISLVYTIAYFFFVMILALVFHMPRIADFNKLRGQL